MSLLYFIGLPLTILYGSHCLKNDIQAEKSDYITQATNNNNTNKDIIQKNFTTICKRSGIKIAKKTNNPINKEEVQKGVNYLKFQGYNNEEIQYFQEIFTQKYEQQIEKEKKDIINKIKELKYRFQHSPCEYQLITWHNTCYQTHNIEERMQQLMQNELWGMIVSHYSYVIRGNNYIEIWNFKVPSNFFNGVNKKKLYNNICDIEQINR